MAPPTGALQRRCVVAGALHGRKRRWRVLRLCDGKNQRRIVERVADVNAEAFGGGYLARREGEDAMEELERVLDQQIGVPESVRRLIMEEGIPKEDSALGMALQWYTQRVKEYITKRLERSLERKLESSIEHRVASERGGLVATLPREKRRANMRRVRRQWHCLYAVDTDLDGYDGVAGTVQVYTSYPTAPLPPPLPLIREDIHTRQAYIANLCVHADYRRSGCATALMSKAVRYMNLPIMPLFWRTCHLL